jgi:hypothetical protein
MSGRFATSASGRRLVPGSLKWMYYYRRYLYQAGTHFIFFEVRQLACCRHSAARRAGSRSASNTMISRAMQYPMPGR